MGKINIYQLDKVENLPYKIGVRKNLIFNREYYRYYSHVNNEPYKLAKRIIENNIGKSFDLAFKYYCNKVKKRFQYIFLEKFKYEYTRYCKYIKYYTDDNGLIQKYIKPKI